MRISLRPGYLASLALALLIVQHESGVASAKSDTAPKASTPVKLSLWRTVIGEQPPVLLSSGVEYAEFPFKSSKAHLLVVDLRCKGIVVAPAVNAKTRPTSTSVQEHGAIAGTNGGFFNTRDGDSTSYVYIDGKKVCDPKNNKLLTGNPRLKPFLETIYKRSELRFLRDKKNNLHIAIAPHDDPLPRGLKIQHSLQGGPQLLPRITDEAEAFVRKESDGKVVDSIGCRKTAARTAVGLTDDSQMMILAVAGKGQDEFSSGVTLSDLAELFRSLGCKSAINFDGGTSTTMVVSLPSQSVSVMPESDADTTESVAQAHSTGGAQRRGFRMVVGRSPETLVKSVLIVLSK